MLDRRVLWTLAAVSAVSVSISELTPRAVSRSEGPAAEILQRLRTFRMMATVLHVGAHPDDENTQLITALARGRAVRTAYLSVTRGDGGQNLLGPEFGYKLGIARTQELIAARQIDGGRQFFTRAIDFGFSKDYQEAFSVWGRDSILSDVVRVVRGFRPDVIVTVFSTQPGGTHGHHTGSAVLALDAFRQAADPKAFPEQLATLAPWQPKRIYVGGRGGAPTGARMEIGGVDPVTGESFASLANRSRGMHKTQGFGQAPAPGQTAPIGGRGGAAAASRIQAFTLIAGDTAVIDIFQGVDTTWGRVPGGAEVERLTAEVMASFDVSDPSKSVPGLLAIKKVVAGLGNDPLVVEKRELLDRIILDCAGVTIQTTIADAEVLPGQSIELVTTLMVTSAIPVTYHQRNLPRATVYIRGLPATPNVSQRFPFRDVVPDTATLTQPYWLQADGTPGMFRVADPALIGLPENPPRYRIVHHLFVLGQSVAIADEPIQIVKDSSGAARVRHLDVVPPASVRFLSDVGVFRPGATQQVAVEVLANRSTPAGSLRLDAPAGWTVAPATRSVPAASAGSRARYVFRVTAPKSVAISSIGVRLTMRGRSWTAQRTAVDYPHIPYQILQPPARFRALSADIATRGKTVAYIPGAGDDIPQALEQLGYSVTQVPAARITADTLRRFDAVVIGVRASNVGPELGAAMPALIAYAEAGGVVIEQYNQNGNNLRNTVLGPYPFTIGSERVTNENAEVTFLAPEHPVLNTPNRITAQDFEGWVQERGLYFANQWDERYTPILAMSDANEAPLKGSLIIAPVGKGYFAYTGLVFFRQLPAGVPGAYRLFANLVSLGKTGPVP